MNSEKNLEKIAEKIEERLINTDVDTIREYITIIHDETDFMEDDFIYHNDEDFFLMMFGDDIMGAVRATKYGNYYLIDDYVVINIYGNLDSYNNLEIEQYIANIAPEMAEIFAEDYINGEGKFKGLEIYKDL